jgi:AraC-like DNA-binding protein
VKLKAMRALTRDPAAGIEGTGLGDSDFRVLEVLLHKGPLPFNTEQGEQLERMAQADGNASGVVKAVIWLKENFDKPFSIKLIAEEANMSPSGLHHHFKTLTNMTPFNIKSSFVCRKLGGSCWWRRWMRLLLRITLAISAAPSSPANTAVCLEPRHFGM